MLFHWLAVAVVLVHLAFVLFVALGGLAALRWRRMIWLHLPALLWGAGIALAGGVCPLTPLELDLRRRAGLAGYDGGFIEHYVVPLLYPHDLDRSGQVGLGLFVLLANLLVYYVWFRRRRAQVAPDSPA